MAMAERRNIAEVLGDGARARCTCPAWARSSPHGSWPTSATSHGSPTGTGSVVDRHRPTQARLDTPGRAYYRRKLAAGKTRMEAMRCLKRRISDAVYRQLLADAHAAQTGPVRAEPGGHFGGVSRIQRGRPASAHRHFGSATSRTRTADATTAEDGQEDLRQEGASDDWLTTEGSR
jgi:hypothetical protein